MHIISPSWPPLHDCFHFLVLPANIRDIPDIRPFSRYCWNLAFDSFFHVKNSCLVKLPSLNFRNTFNLCPLIPPSISLGLHHYIADHGQQKLFLEHDRPFFFSKVKRLNHFSFTTICDITPATFHPTTLTMRKTRNLQVQAIFVPNCVLNAEFCEQLSLSNRLDI